ncbi:MAG: heparan-alpha-glucosaminide N-acetyltransferase domain-containing protein [Eubacteriales bacterium]|nr:heparan-alpha-glucosaminide N-acetyltransferase domain-containing protein [Eubacteriales bacterium]
MHSKRYAVLDGIRGFTLINMILYHAIWDLIHLFGFPFRWYDADAAYIWQQFICWTFILLSGFCQPLGKKKLKRGLIILLLGFLISAVTAIAMPENRVRFGILTLLGSCMLWMIPLERLLKQCNPLVGIIASATLFITTRNIYYGSLGFGEWNLLALPACWYHNAVTAYFGFPPPDFYSPDYFPLFPWSFLFTTGYFLHQFLSRKGVLRYLINGRAPVMEWLGRHSLGLYVVHQPLLYLLFTLLFSG